MDSGSSSDRPGGNLPEGASTDAAPGGVPAAAEALCPAVPAEALPSAVPTDQILANPVPAEALLGGDPAEILPIADELVPDTEVPVPSLDDVVAPAGDRSAALDPLGGGGELTRRIESFDWAPTPLGNMAERPQALRSAVSLMLASGFPMSIVWGPESIQLYNDACVTVLGTRKHPATLGQR